MSKLPNYDFINMIQEGTLDVIEWLALQDEESIRERVYERVPEELDTSVGSYEYDAIEPTNTEFAVVYFMLRNVILLAFPQYSFGKWLTLASEAKGVYRKEATYANGELTITGTKGVSIPAGTKFTNAIPTGSELPIKYYSTQEDVTIGEEGICQVKVVSDLSGIKGNATIGEICLNIADIPNLTLICNKEAFTNGADEESDASLLERLLERVRHPTSSGNKNDYRQWAKEVPGVEDAETIPLWNGPGTVKVIIVGADGMPIPDIVPIVKEYLDPSDQEGEGEGRAPIGAVVTVVTTDHYVIRVDINELEYQSGYNLSLTKSSLVKAIKKEVSKVKLGGLIRIHDVEDAVRHTTGIRDFQEVLLNGKSCNIQIPVHLKPVVEEVYFDGSS